MKKPSPTAHLKRLGLVFAVGLVCFVGIKTLATPASWNHDISNWYRLDALEELKKLPIAYGSDNKACKSCHKKTYDKFRKKKHTPVSCESCHGALADHADGTDKKTSKKIGDSPVFYGVPKHLEGKGGTEPVVVDDPRNAGVMWQCWNCHAPTINKPKFFKQFKLDPNDQKFAKHIKFVAGEFKPGTMCLKCHDPHDPTP